jgi:hypothetical protein
MDRNIEYHGLRERPNYEDIVNYLATEKPKQDYPFDRKATILRNSPYMTMLDGENGMDLTDFENRLEKDKLREILIRENSRSTGESLASSRASTSVGRDTPPLHPSDVDERVASEMSDHDDMLAAFRAREDDRRAAMGALGGEAVGSLHGPRDAAASALAAARGTLGGLYDRFRGPRTVDEAIAMQSAIEEQTPRRRHERGRGPTTKFKGKFS